MRKVEKGLLPPPKPTKFNRALLEKVMSVIGYNATRWMIERDAVFHVWRNSSPHNRWVAPRTNEHNYIWHSDGWGDCPPLKAFCGVSDEGVVSYGNGPFQGGDAGMARWSKFVANPKLKGVWYRMSDADKRAMKKRAQLAIESKTHE